MAFCIILGKWNWVNSPFTVLKYIFYDVGNIALTSLEVDTYSAE